MRRSLPVLTAAALVALTGCGATATSASHSHPAALTAAATPAATSASATLTTTGTGTVSVKPDVMTVQIGVANSATHVSAALNANNKISAAVQAALEHHGVPVADIQTVELSVYAQQSRKKATSYHVSDVVSASLHNLKTAGTILDAALGAAGNAGRLDGVSFSVGNAAPSLAQARKRAVTNAHLAAQQLAAAGGLTLGGLRSLTDHTNPYQFNSDEVEASTAGAGGSSVPLQAGTQQTTVQVTAVWAVRS
jgi:uncharacterized protein YggE